MARCLILGLSICMALEQVLHARVNNHASGKPSWVLMIDKTRDASSKSRTTRAAYVRVHQAARMHITDASRVCGLRRPILRWGPRTRPTSVGSGRSRRVTFGVPPLSTAHRLHCGCGHMHHRTHSLARDTAASDTAMMANKKATPGVRCRGRVLLHFRRSCPIQG